MKENWVYRRGDIYMANLNPFKGSEQGGTCPVLVLQNNTGNLFCPTLIVAPLTTQVNKKKDQPTHYLLSGVRGLPEDSVALSEQIKTIDKSRIITVAADCKQSEAPDQSETSDRRNSPDNGGQQDELCKGYQHVDPGELWGKAESIPDGYPPLCPGRGNQRGREKYFQA